MTTPANPITAHYHSDGLGGRILAALREMGKDTDALTTADLSPVDQFHSQGFIATRELGRLAGFQAGQRVLDVGSGLGGPARHLAEAYGCDVTGIDLTPEFCDVANLLSARVGLGERTRFQAASALDLPFEDAAFDAAWSMQVQMNIADKPRFYGEIFRVLKPGGRFVFQDIFQGERAGLHFPVPWAETAELNFLVTPAEARATIEGVGFAVAEWRDAGQAIREWNAKQAARTGEPPPLGLHLVMGATAAAKRRNQTRNLAEGHVTYIQGAVQKPV